MREGGSRTWVFRYRLGSKQRVMTFGSAEVMSAQQAREQAQRLHAQVKLGLDPAGGKIESQARATEIFEYAVKIFLTRQKERLKPRSFLEAERHLLMHARPLHPRPLAKIERRDIAIRLNEIANASGPAAANRVRTSLSALYAWAMREGLVEHNPVANTNKAVERGSRERVLNASELRAIWHALPDDDFGDIIKLLALTGQRRDEIGRLRWDEVNLDAIAATLLTAFGFFWGYLVERRTLSIWWINEGLALLLLALPGSVIGIGLIGLWNHPATNFIYASPAILILGYLAQYAVLPMRTVSASIAAVPRSLEEAAWLSGAGWLTTLQHIVAPLAGRGLLAAWLISYVFCVRDVAISIVVYPPGYDTLPVRILTLMANGAPSLIAALCIILITITILPLGAAGLWLKLGTSRP